MNNSWMISGPCLYTEVGRIEQGSIVIHQGKIAALSPAMPSANIQCYTFPANYHLIPGLIDFHVHGAAGADSMDIDEGAFNILRQALVQEGVTSYLATITTASKEKIELIIDHLTHCIKEQDQFSGATCLGLYLEGPFISSKRAGALKPEFFLEPDFALLSVWCNLAKGLIKVMTFAPELPQADELFRFLTDHQVIASIGHTDAAFEITQKMLDLGCDHATHLFNAMPPIHHRAPGAVTALLLDERACVEVIADGIHLHPAIVKLIFKLKGKDRILGITDAMRAKYLIDGEYELGGQNVHVKNNRAILTDGTLAGSTLKMNEAFRNMIAWTACSIEEAIAMYAGNSAKRLGLYDQIGSLQVGKEADFVVMDSNFNVVMTVCKGVICYRREID